MDNYWLDLLATIMSTLVPLILTVVGLLILNWAKKKGLTSEQVRLLEEGFSFLKRAVTSTNQIWVDALKSAEGGLTQEQQQQARKATEEAFKAMLTEAVELAIKAAYGSVDKWLEINLEAAVGEVKNSRTTAIIAPSN